MTTATIISIAVLATILTLVIIGILFYFCVYKKSSRRCNIFRRQQVYNDCPDSAKRLSLLGNHYKTDFHPEPSSHKTSLESFGQILEVIIILIFSTVTFSPRKFGVFIFSKHQIFKVIYKYKN